MPFIVKIGPNVTQPQAAVIPTATPGNDGVMSAAQAAALASLVASNEGLIAFLFQPGGTPGGGVFVDWPSLMAAVDASVIPRTIFFDDSLAPCIVPAGTWNMTDVLWQSVYGHTSHVEVQEGAVFTRLRQISGLVVTFSGTTPPVSDFLSILGPFTADFDVFIVGSRSIITTSGAGPFIRMTQMPAPAVIALDTSASLVTGTVPVVDIVVGVFAVISVLSAAQLESNTISGQFGSLAILVAVDSSSMISLTQPAMLGAFGIVNICQARVNPTFLLIGPTSYNAQTNDVVRCDTTGGNITVPFPKASLFPGLPIVVKNQSNDAINSIVPTAFAGDTVDGLPSVNVTGSRAFATYVSDGISDWMSV